jgi:hypothetical protein
MVSYLDQDGVQHLVDKMRDRMYPVDSIYISTNSTSPASLYGGSWERYGKGRTLVSANESDTDFTAGKTGGEKMAPVDLTEMYALWANRGKDFIADVKTIPGNTVWRATVKSQQVNHFATTDVANNGVRVILPEGNNHRRVSTIQPYVAVFIWRRLS